MRRRISRTRRWLVTCSDDAQDSLSFVYEDPRRALMNAAGEFLGTLMTEYDEIPIITSTTFQGARSLVLSLHFVSDHQAAIWTTKVLFRAEPND